MRLYEYDKNAENKISIEKKIRDGIVFGTENTLQKIIFLIKNHNKNNSSPCILAFEGNYCIEWDAIINYLKKASESTGLKIDTINISTVFKSEEEINAYKKPFITDDPSFGYENSKGRIQDIMDMNKVKKLQFKLEESRKNNNSTLSAIVVYAPGAAVEELINTYDYRFYFEMTKDPIMWNLWSGTLIPFGMDKPSKEYTWKDLYYIDFNLLDNQKWYILEHMDFFVSAVDVNNLIIMSKNEYDVLITTLLNYPIKQIKIFMPGPFGAYRYRDLWEVKNLENSAWNNITSPKLDLLVDIGEDKNIRLPSVNLLQYGDRLVGHYWNKEVPKWWPLIAALDDGYYPDKKTPLERTAMCQHNHPPTDYVRRNFNEQFGRYETYYIAEAYEGSATIMGFKEDADLEEWEKKCWEADKNKTLIKDWKNFVKIWDTAVGDLFLIPPGTTHGHGGRQMVLELDTNVNTSTCEYSFYMHDYGRNTWDDNKKSMTGKPCKLHCKDGFNIEKWRREKWVSENLRARPKVLKWTKDYTVEQYSTLPEMPFHIERFHFKKFAENDTEGKFMQVVTLTVGNNITIRSKKNPEYHTSIEWLQSAVIPATYGEYEFINNGEGQCTVVQSRMKKG